jgi:acyl-coenzyme A synthetase/AMP-(fatty) acid ligase
VDEAAVIGVPDDLLGEVPVAFVVTRSGTTPSEAELRRFCQERLPAYAIPVGFDVVSALPRNETGKLMRCELSARLERSALAAPSADVTGGEARRRLGSQRSTSQGDARWQKEIDASHR